jgi:hypothetical protein
MARQSPRIIDASEPRKAVTLFRIAIGSILVERLPNLLDPVDNPEPA